MQITSVGLTNYNQKSVNKPNQNPQSFGLNAVLQIARANGRRFSIVEIRRLLSKPLGHISLSNGAGDTVILSGLKNQPDKTAIKNLLPGFKVDFITGKKAQRILAADEARTTETMLAMAENRSI